MSRRGNVGFICDQELFKNQLEILKAKINATNAYSNTMNMRLNSEWENILMKSNQNDFDLNFNKLFSGRSVDSTLPPSLGQIKEEFARKRVVNCEKMFDLLTKLYPNMSEAEARRLAMKL